MAQDVRSGRVIIAREVVVIGSDDGLASERAARIEGFAPIREYAAIGDGRPVALVARDGSIDWFTSPAFDSPTVLGALLEPERAGSFELSPEAPFRATRRYVPGTAVLETSFITEGGAVPVTDTITIPAGGLTPLREVARRIDGVSGSVPVRWRVTPRFEYGTAQNRIARRGGVAVASSGSDALAVQAFDAGEVDVGPDAVSGRSEIRAGETSLVTLSVAHQEPLVFSSRAEIEHRLRETIAAWRRWSSSRIATPASWAEAVERSAITLKLLVHAPSGAVVAAPTTSLPEVVGGERNWDYRYCWIRDSAFTLDALLRLGCSVEADAFFRWLMQASQLTHPRLKVLYRIDGGAEARERVLDLAGYRASTPVRIGNGAVDQVQHDIYGDLLETAWEYAKAGGRIDAEIGWRLAGAAADHVVSVGAGFGLIHGLFAGSALVNILLPIVHPRMGTPTSSIASALCSNRLAS
jgi:GH15 family glucan-1,4-alpha-glucosidase